MYKRIKGFAKDENGAVTVDWIVLTASIMLLGVLTLSLTNGGIQTQAEKVRDGILAADD